MAMKKPMKKPASQKSPNPALERAYAAELAANASMMAPRRGKASSPSGSTRSATAKKQFEKQANSAATMRKLEKIYSKLTPAERRALGEIAG
jgi:hypothetical protein